jgi:hypothetical protein
MMIAVLARNYKEFKQFRDIYFDVHPESTEILRYVSSKESADGCVFSDYKIVGTFYQRRDASKLLDIVKISTEKKRTEREK